MINFYVERIIAVGPTGLYSVTDERGEGLLETPVAKKNGSPLRGLREDARPKGVS